MAISGRRTGGWLMAQTTRSATWHWFLPRETRGVCGHGDVDDVLYWEPVRNLFELDANNTQGWKLPVCRSCLKAYIESLPIPEKLTESLLSTMVDKAVRGLAN